MAAFRGDAECGSSGGRRGEIRVPPSAHQTHTYTSRCDGEVGPPNLVVAVAPGTAQSEFRRLRSLPWPY